MRIPISVYNLIWKNKKKTFTGQTQEMFELKEETQRQQKNPKSIILVILCSAAVYIITEIMRKNTNNIKQWYNKI